VQLVKAIEIAPRNGDFIVLQDACSWEVGRWSQEAERWVRLDGTPVRISPAHWTQISGDVVGATDQERLLFLASSLQGDEIGRTQKRPITLSILVLATVVFCSGGFGGFWIGSHYSNSENSAAELEREFSQERARAYAGISSLTSTRELQPAGLAEASESRRIAKDKESELKLAGESEAKAEARAYELASAREHDVAARNLAAAHQGAQALETERAADAEQRELKQLLDNSKTMAHELMRDPMSAREPTTTAVKPPDAELFTQDSSPTRHPLSRPIEGVGIRSEAAGSLTNPQSTDGSKVEAQTSSDARPDDTATGSSGRLAPANRLQQGSPQPSNVMSSADEAKFVTRARSLIWQSDFSGARLFLEHAVEKGSALAAFLMAETYDWQVLRSLRAYGVRGDAQLARRYYELAANAGIAEARERMKALQTDIVIDAREGEDRQNR
jgi:hypothetical protein